MAPRANWKGFLRLSLVTCPIALFPATSETEKVSFNQINKNTGHRIKYAKVDAETGEEVSNDDIIKGYKVDTDTYVTVDKDELDNIALESTRTIDIDEFVPKSDIDELYLVRPYYIVPEKFEDRYENALVELLNQKRKGEPIRTAAKPRDTGNVVNLMDALRKSLSDVDVGKRGASQPAKGRKPKKAASGQREMLMAISGKGDGKAKPAAKESKRPTRQRKAG